MIIADIGSIIKVSTWGTLTILASIISIALFTFGYTNTATIVLSFAAGCLISFIGLVLDEKTTRDDSKMELAAFFGQFISAWYSVENILKEFKLVQRNYVVGVDGKEYISSDAKLASDMLREAMQNPNNGKFKIEYREEYLNSAELYIAIDRYNDVCLKTLFLIKRTGIKTRKYVKIQNIILKSTTACDILYQELHRLKGVIGAENEIEDCITNAKNSLNKQMKNGVTTSVTGAVHTVLKS